MNEEFVIIGTILKNPDALQEAAGTIDLDDFKHTENKNIFINIMSDYGKHGKTSATAVLQMTDSERERVVIQSSYDAADGFDYRNFERAVTVLKRKRKLREIQNIAKLMERAVLDDKNPDAIIEASFERLWKLGEAKENDRPVITAEVAADEFMESYEHREQNPDEPLGLPLHYVDDKGNRRGLSFVEDYMQGLRGGDLVIVAGKTGTGKTGLGMNIARIVSAELGKRPYYMNTEMDLLQMMDRLISAGAGVPHYEVTTSKLSGSPTDKLVKRERIVDAVRKIRESPLLLSELPTLTKTRISQLAKQTKNMFGTIDLIIIDYMGRLEMEGSKSAATWDMMYENAKYLKELARRMNIPIIVLAQLNDEGKLEGAKKMANEADAVWYWEEIDAKDGTQQKRLKDAGLEPEDANYTMKIFKNRRGRGAGSYIHFDFAKSYQSIDQVDETRGVG